MKQRVITALILAPLVIFGIFLLPLPWFMFAIAIVTLIGFWEWTQFINIEARITAFLPAFLVSVICLYLFSSSYGIHHHHINFYMMALLSVAVVWWCIASVLAITYPKTCAFWKHSKLLPHCFGFLTLIPFFWSIVALRTEFMDEQFYHGAKLVMYVCFIVWAADSGAYFSGRLFGRHKMAPSVSPNKTIEGLIGGIIAAMFVGYLFAGWFEITFTSMLSMLSIIFVTVVFSVLGDLVESMFKRVAGIKDSSHIIPGHGGVLDRIDSLTAAFPVFAFLYFLV
ncbi:phosphatidate cytidylyltransferase [Vibrio salinus]|uniref:phosphatidate cytidylyltransferase n=1 Tax=Vibrio salinus TaxID=2899784 RepID=UPI001E50F191|nr:phosphatidate cytidylyltransferase [Vibrio salinus]MCE0494387.1 phosphatidate cytidylyltransferase [Vibrio salinus]